MVVAGTSDAIMMVEGEANQVSEEHLLEGIAKAHEVIGQIVALQQELVARIGKTKWPYTPPAKNQAVYDAVTGFLGSQLHDSVTNPDKVMRVEGTDELKQSVISHFAASGDAPAEFARKDISETFDSLLKSEVRSGILRDGSRPDGRCAFEVRPIWSQVGYLPRAHGSAIFTRGQDSGPDGGDARFFG